MAKLYFKYGAMGCGKSAQCLMTKYNYESKHYTVWFIKPATDIRDGSTTIKSRIGLISEVDNIILANDNIYDMFVDRCYNNFYDDNNSVWFDNSHIVIICDESQFFTSTQIEQLRSIVYEFNCPVICYGLLTDFQTKLFEGSKRLVELAESIQEVKSICKCGNKATINARIDSNGDVTTKGESIELGADEKYQAMCYDCWQKSKRLGEIKEILDENKEKLYE